MNKIIVLTALIIVCGVVNHITDVMIQDNNQKELQGRKVKTEHKVYLTHKR